MNETFTYTAGHDPMLGWVALGLCALIAFFGRKRRTFLGPVLGAIGATVYLVLRLDESYGRLFPVLIFVGLFLDAFRAPETAKKSVAAKLGLIALSVLPIAGFTWMAIGDEPNRVVITDSQLIEQHGRDAFFRQWSSTSLGKAGMSATVIRYSDGELMEYRFRSASTPDVMLPIRGYGFYRDESGKLWTPDELCQRITKWAAVSPIVKTEKRPPVFSVSVD